MKRIIGSTIGALLVSVRPSFEAHLKHAKELQAKLGKTGA